MLGTVPSQQEASALRAQAGSIVSCEIFNLEDPEAMNSSPDTQLTLERLERALLWNLNILEALKEGLGSCECAELAAASVGRVGGRQEELVLRVAVPLPREATELSFLEEVARRIREFAILSLAGNPVVADGFLESRQGLGGLARIRVREAPSRVLIYVDAFTVRTRRKLHRKHLPQRLQRRLSAFQVEAVVPIEETTVASYAINVDRGNAWALSLSITRVALAFIEVRKALMADLGDFTRGPVFVLEAPARPAGHGYPYPW